MANEVHKTETLLSSELLITHQDSLSQNQRYTNFHGSSSESNLNGLWSWDSSSSSGLSTPLGSELGSTTETTTESDEDNFMAELTRQMADYMLQEDDEDNDGVKLTSIPVHVQKLDNIDIYSTQTLANSQIGPIQCYQLQNQPLVNHQGSIWWGRRTKSEQKLQRKEHHAHMHNIGVRASGFGYGGTKVRPLDSLQSESGMRAIFLGGSGSRSRSGSCGTGVFLPSGTNKATEPRKKSGCSTVLIPARVLEALQPHFNSMHAQSQLKNCINHPAQHDAKGRSGMHSERNEQLQTSAVLKSPELLQLPQEWTY